EQVVPGAIRVESERVGPAHVVQSSPFVATDLAPPPALRERAEALAREMGEAGLACNVSDSEAQVLWTKLALLAPFALGTSGAGLDLVVVTSGDKGTRDVATTAADLAATREREQRAAAELLGIGRVEFLRHRDAEVVDSLELRGLLVREIRRSRPDVLLTFSP